MRKYENNRADLTLLCTRLLQKTGLACKWVVKIAVSLSAGQLSEVGVDRCILGGGWSLSSSYIAIMSVNQRWFS